MTDIVNKAYQATPNATLRDQSMNPKFLKNERVSWAAAEIERLRAALFEIAGMHEFSFHDYSPITRLWMHQKVARDALGLRGVELVKESR